MSVKNKKEDVQTSMANEHLNELKEFFKSEINSNRTFEKILNIEELIDVLEDRDALTEDVLLQLGPSFKDLVYSKRTNLNGHKNSSLAPDVAELIRENFESDWKGLGVKLKLSQDQLHECNNVESVLLRFENNCKGISNQEMIFRLIRALEKSEREDLKLKIEEMIH